MTFIQVGSSAARSIGDVDNLRMPGADNATAGLGSLIARPIVVNSPDNLLCFVRLG